MRFKVLLISTLMGLSSAAIAQEVKPNPTATARVGSSARAQVDKISQEFMAACDRKDAKAVAQMYHSQGRMLPGNSAPVLGRAEIEKTWKSYFDAGLAEFKLQTESAEQHGDIVVELGSYTATSGGKPENGKYVVLYKKEGDGWKLWVDSFSSNAPPVR